MTEIYDADTAADNINGGKDMFFTGTMNISVTWPENSLIRACSIANEIDQRI
jgi:hypothetical protein